MRLCWEGLAATYSSTPWGAVPLALRGFTVEFGMGSGVSPSPWPPGPPSRGAGGWWCLRCSCDVPSDTVGWSWWFAWPAGGVVGRGFCGSVGVGVGLSVRTAGSSWVFKPVERLGPVSCTRCRASTSGLSTWWSSTALWGDLVLRGVSRLDAFSGYPVRT